jgi:hypothetical protein
MARGSWIATGILLGLRIGKVAAEEHTKIPLPSYHYGAAIPVSCLNRSM